MIKKLILLLLILYSSNALIAQPNIDWYKPAYVEGICVQDTLNIFHRLPVSLKGQVRQPVWDLSLNTAGEYIDFCTDAEKVTVRYGVLGNLSMPHMPTTGVSGVALWAITKDGAWTWAPGNYRFADTITYTYRNLVFPKNGIGSFRLYLPLYNTISWLSIGIPKGKKFAFNPKSSAKPIIAYGTSILQGAVASRPDLAWSNILSRAIDRTVINLGFSGNGRIEGPIIDLMATIDAKMYIIDCMPNLTRSYGIPDSEINERVKYAITKLREKNKTVPILFSCHSGGYATDYLDTAKTNQFKQSSELITTIYNRLKKSGIENIYLLRDEEIGFDANATVEGLHPNDIGMIRYATAYENKIRRIINEPKGKLSTTIATQQSRDTYNWKESEGQVLNHLKIERPTSVIIGSPIMHSWQHGFEEEANRKFLLPQDRSINCIQTLGSEEDRIENTLWRVYHSDLSEYPVKNVLLMVGANNLIKNTDEEILAGYQSLINAVKYRQPQATITLIGLLPRNDMISRITHLNRQMQKVAAESHVRFANIGNVLLNHDKKINKALFEEGVHINQRGYELISRQIDNVITNLEKTSTRSR